MYGIQTNFFDEIAYDAFENDVKMYGIQTKQKTRELNNVWYSNLYHGDVEVLPV